MFFKRQPLETKLTLLQVLDAHYAVYANLTKGSMRRYRCELNRLQRIVGPVPISGFDIETFTTFRTKCVASGLSNDSTEGSIKIAKAVLRYCKDRGWIGSLPHFGRSLRIAPPDPHPATVEEIEALWESARTAVYPGRGIISPCTWWRCWLTLDWYTGLRIEDSLHLAASHIHADRIEYVAAKTGTIHRWPMCDPVRRAVSQLMANDLPTLFGRFPQNKLREVMTSMCEHAGIRRLTCKNVRQGCVQNWMKVDPTAGAYVHGCGLTHQVLGHYTGVLDILNEHLPKLQWPRQMMEAGVTV